MVYGLAPAVLLRARTKRPFPFLQLRSAFPADSLRVRWVPLFRSFRRLGAFAFSPHPDVHGFPVLRLLCPIRLFLKASGFRWALAYLRSTTLSILQQVFRVRLVGLKRNDVGGVLLDAPSALCGSSMITRRVQ